MAPTRTPDPEQSEAVRGGAPDNRKSQTANRKWPPSRRWLAAILIAALLARVAAVLFLHTLPPIAGADGTAVRPAERPLFPDSLEYLRMAANVAAGRGFVLDKASRIGRMPGYPVFIAAAQALLGHGLLGIRVMQAIVGTVGVWLAWRLGRAMFGDGAGLWAAAMAAGYPFLILFTPLVLAETLFVTLLLWAMLCVRAAAVDRRTGAAALAGLALGLATLVRASLLLAVPLLALAWVVWRRFERPELGRAALMVAVFAAAMTPWIVRNYSASDGHLVVTTLRAGPSLYEAFNPEAYGGPMMERIDWGQGTEGLTEYERNELWRRRAVDWAKANPARVVALAWRKGLRFWNVVPNAPQARKPLVCAAIGVPYVVVMALAAVGAGAARRRPDVYLILLLPLVYYALLHMVFVGSLRYRLPVMPLLMVLAGHGVVLLWRRVRKPR